MVDIIQNHTLSAMRIDNNWIIKYLPNFQLNFHQYEVYLYIIYNYIHISPYNYHPLSLQAGDLV